MSDNVCYCCSGIALTECCKPLIDGVRSAVSAEELMRSRYSAYASMAIDYIIQTTHVSTRMHYSTKSIRAWAESSHWMKLEIVNSIRGKQSDSNGKVEFKAYFKDAVGINHIHHEFSTFRKEKNVWFFVEGIVFNLKK